MKFVSIQATWLTAGRFMPLFPAVRIGCTESLVSVVLRVGLVQKVSTCLRMG